MLYVVFFMGKNTIIAYLVVVTITVSLLIGGNSVYADKQECKERGTSHGDNSPSEKAFFKALNTDTLCDFSDGIDEMKYKGAIRENSKCDWECFMDTNVFQTAFDDAKMCMSERYDLPDDGKKNLEAYEIQACAQGNY